MLLQTGFNNAGTPQPWTFGSECHAMFPRPSSPSWLLAATLLFAPMFSPAAVGKPGGGGGGNSPPAVVIVSPQSGTRFEPGATVRIEANATDSDGRIARVAFYVGTSLIGSRSRAPFTIDWSASPGSHVLTAVATDSSKAQTTSTAVTIEVAALPDTTAPTPPSDLVAAGLGSDWIALSWSASSDDRSGIAGYELYRDGGLIATVATTGHTDAGLNADSTYEYRVRAIDGAGNGSSPSAALIVRTQPTDVDDPGSSPDHDRRVVGYFTQWGIYSHGYTVASLDRAGVAERLTHLIYAFGNVRNDRCELGVLKATNSTTGEGGDAWADYARPYSAADSVDGVGDAPGQALRGHWNQLRKLKQRHPDLRIMISLGGWTWSRGFASAARPENREAFVASCIDAYIHGNLPSFDGADGPGAAAELFDGFDIDWEYPAACGLTCGGSEDTDNFTALLAEFRRQLDAIRPGLQLSAAVGAGIDKIRVTRPDQYHPALDFINLMTYDFHGAWESRTNFHSALFGSPDDPSQGDARLYNSHDAVSALIARGVPASKITLGIASYGRGWTRVGPTDNGLYQTGVAADGSLEPGIESYRRLAAQAAPEYFDPASMARWTYDGSSFWSFDTPETIADKTRYVAIEGLGGAFLWDLAGDDSDGALAHALAAGLR